MDEVRLGRRRPRTCLVCGKTWPGDRDTCPLDGADLAEVTLDAKPGNRPTLRDLEPADSSRSRARGRIRQDAAFDAPTEPQLEPQQGSVSPPDTNVGSVTQQSLSGRVALAPRARASLLPGFRVGDYEIDAKIGEGAMSEVYRAVHPAIGRRVAIKLISPRLFDDPDAHERFINEARALASIHHPGIVDVFGFGTLEDGRLYLIMEWLQGRDLRAHLQHGQLSLYEAADIIMQIANALRAAHDKSIVHRDLKPENVFLVEIEDEKPLVKLLDFGLAKRPGEELSKTRTGQLLGTPLYLSPEQARGKSVDHRTDIYALGCMGYQLFTGQLPFRADNVADLLSAHLNGTPPAPRSLCPSLPADLDALLIAMVAKDPSQRPALVDVRRTVKAAIAAVTGAVDAKLPLPAPATESLPPGAIAPDDEVATVEMPLKSSYDEQSTVRQPVSVRPPQAPLYLPAPMTRSNRLALIGAVLVLLALLATLAALLHIS